MSWSPVSIPAHAEVYYGNDVEAQLHAGGWHLSTSADYSIPTGLVLKDLFAFLEATQPGHYYALAERGADQLAGDLKAAIAAVGTAAALKHGIDVSGRHLRLCGFKPQFAAAASAGHSDYPHNRFTVIRELEFNEDKLRLDFALFLNGIPFSTVELKSELSEQSATDAMEQYREDRLPEYGAILQPLTGAIAHFAVSQDLAALTTSLRGADTEFYWFNPGYDYVKPVGHSYLTDYVWQQVFSPNNVLELLEYFIFQKGGEVLFPRFHQWECVQQIKQDVLSRGVGHRYLQQHSAGSGKSNTISWLAYQLAYLTSEGTTPVFDKVLVVTDRIALDRQLGGVLSFMQGTTLNQMANCLKTKDLLRELTGHTRIVVTTIQKFRWLNEILTGKDGSLDATALAKIRKLRFAVLIDEAHSSQGGDYFGKMVSHLTTHTRAGRQTPNLSFFAFTATPREETLGLFGQKNTLGDLVPFHAYSMQQAIDEGYILDVRKGYHAVAIGYVVESTKTGQLVKTPKDVFRHIFEDPAVVKAKAREALRVFSTGIAPLLGGLAQGMVVCNSRKAAVLFKLALDELITEQELAFATLCAFTDEIKLAGRTYDEFNINGLPKETDLGALFKDCPAKYKLLVVADKFQVGFDCPRLTALFVDKGLEDLTAVQTLSRLNRSFPHKDSTLVMDFVNKESTVMRAFDKFIEPLATVPRDVLPRLAELTAIFEAKGLWSPAELEEHWRMYRSSPDKLYGLMAPIKGRFTALAKNEREATLPQLAEFKDLYAFGAKICPDVLDYQKVAALVATLIRYVDKKEAKKSACLPLKVVAATVLTKVDAAGTDDEGPVIDVPAPDNGDSKAEPKEPAAKELSALLLDLSRRSLAELADPIHAIIEGLVFDARVSRQAKGNPFDTFSSEGITQRLLDDLATQQVLLIPTEHSDKLRKALLERTQEARDTRNNLLRVVFLRIVS